MKGKKKRKIIGKEEKILPILTKECPECGSTNVKYNADKDELLCLDCGAIFAELTSKEEEEFEEAYKQK